MDMPENVRVSKDKLPKGSSYPLQTTELLEGLSLSRPEMPVSIHFGMVKVYKATWSILWANFNFVHPDKIDTERSFAISVFSCPSSARFELHRSLTGEALPIIAAWITDQKNQDGSRKLELSASLENDAPLDAGYARYDLTLLQRSPFEAVKLWSGTFDFKEDSDS